MGDENELFVSVVLAEEKSKTVLVNKNKTTQTLYDAVAPLMGLQPDQFQLFLHAKLLNGRETIQDLGIREDEDPCTITVVVGYVGGGQSGQLDLLGTDIKLTKEECCYTLESDPKTDRAKMPCGHVISPEGMMDLFNKASRKTVIDCPGVNCKAKWDFALVQRVLSATMTSKQLKEASGKVDAQFFKSPLHGIRACPRCGSYGMRDFTKQWYANRNRVCCIMCAEANHRSCDFCWLCGKEWKGGDTCGNAACSAGQAEAIKILQGCDTIDINVSGCPSIRACPRCCSLIHHEGGCKHMTCKCGCEFCFTCLKIRTHGKWQCGEHDSVCTVAPRQTSLTTSSTTSNDEGKASSAPPRAPPENPRVPTRRTASNEQGESSCTIL